MKVNVKKLHHSAVVPSYAKPGDAGLDLTAISVSFDDENGTIDYGTGLAVEIPEGHVGLIFPRSSQRKKDLVLTNHVGVIDSGYRGEIKFSFKPTIEYWDVLSNEKKFYELLTHCVFAFYERAVDEHYDYGKQASTYALGDRIGQIIILPYPNVEFNIVTELSETERGEGGFGSTGK